MSLEPTRMQTRAGHSGQIHHAPHKESEMKNEHFVQAHPGCRAWDIFEEAGRSLVTFSGDVVAWRMTPSDYPPDGESMFVAKAVLLGPLDAAVVERDGILFHADGCWHSFEAWLKDTGAMVYAADAQRARDWYGISEKFIEIEDLTRRGIDERPPRRGYRKRRSMYRSAAIH